MYVVFMKGVFLVEWLGVGYGYGYIGGVEERFLVSRCIYAGCE